MPTSPTTIHPPTAKAAANRGPQASGTIPPQDLIVGSEPTLVDVAPFFSDPDGDKLAYAATSSDPDTVTATVSGGIVTLTAVAAGPATVTVTATDPGNLTATQMLRYRTTWDALAPTATWRGLTVADEKRCSPYDPDDYSYSQSVEDEIVDLLGGIYSPYTCETFESTRETDIEHIVARSEAHDSGLCDAETATRERFARDLLNLTLASPVLNRNEKRDKDAAEWQPDQNTCWFAKTVVNVRLAYGLTVDPQERDALERMLAGCSSTAIACDLEPSNQAPEAVGTIPAQTLRAGGSTSSVEVAPYFRDPDDDVLTYTAASSSTGTVTASTTGSTVTLTPVAAGTATVNVTASDGSLNATQAITVTVTASSDLRLFHRGPRSGPESAPLPWASPARAGIVFNRLAAPALVSRFVLVPLRAINAKPAASEKAKATRSAIAVSPAACPSAQRDGRVRRETPRGTESGGAPAWQGSTKEILAIFDRGATPSTRDAAPFECSGAFSTDC